MKQVSVIVAIVSFLLISCAKVPFTGRKQAKLLPESTMNSMSFTQYEEFLKENPPVNNTNQANMVKSVGRKIQQAAEKYYRAEGISKKLEGFAWEFNLVDDPTVNAWCMPGGKVAFYTGIMPICQDEAGVAVVMGHEVAHAIANHGRERMSQGLVQQMGGVALAVAMQDKPEETQALFFAAYAVGTTYGAMLPYSRLHESEADKLGLIFMAMAGYDPHEAPKFWERMASQSGGSQPPEWMSTHPSHESRIQALNDYMPTAMKYYNKQQKPTTKGGLIKR